MSASVEDGALPGATARRVQTATEPDHVLKFKRRMLLWPNPVEFVNNMYGSHPDDDDEDYFPGVFRT
jgi:hypothetical protein